MADSSTGGFLVPDIGNETGRDLENFMHDLIAGVTGMGGAMVRPKWSADPLPEPPPGENWCAFGVEEEGNSTMPGEWHHDDGKDGFSTTISHGPVPVLVSFYGHDSRANAKRLRLGLPLSQNREYLYQHDFGLYEVGSLIHVPEVVGEVWNDRYDVRFVLNRRENARFDILHIKSNEVAVTTEHGLEVKGSGKL